METAGTRVHDPRQAIFKDGLGTRFRHEAADGPVDILLLRDAFAPIRSFEFLVRERVNRLAHVRSTHFARVYDVEHVGDGPKIALISQTAAGVRLSRLLSTAEQNLLPLDIQSALYLIDQILVAMAELHDDAPDACHGTLASERIVVSSTGDIIIVEHVLGAALAQLRHSPDRYWKELRITLPIAVTAPVLDRRADVAAIGMIALALLLGRPIADDEYPGDVASLASGSFGLGGGFEPIPEWLREWLSQALSLEPTRWFASAVEARQAFEAGLKSGELKASKEKLEAFLREYSRFDPIEPARSLSEPVRHTAEPARSVATAAPSAPPLPIAVVTPPKPESQTERQPEPVKAAVPSPVPVPKPEPIAAAASITRVVPAPPRREEVEEDEDMAHMPTPQGYSSGSFNRPRLIAAAVVVIAVTSGGVMAARRYFAAPPTVAPVTGTVAVNSEPAGANVVIDGQAHGTTPTTATLSVGAHTIELASDGVRRTLNINVTANTQISQFVEMPKATAGTGDLQVRTDPSGARVSVDGQVRGTSPLTIPGLAPGSHSVTLENDLGSVREDVTIQPGATASLVVPLKTPQGAPVSGWISINAPAELQIFENQRLLGSSRTDRIMVAAGRHDIEFSNEALGYRASQTIQVAPGQVARIKPDWPSGTIAINATPWANVTLDGQDLGETPVGNTSVPVGTHEVVFRHPQFGEQRITATVTATTPTRLSIDMRKK
ncbi:MAG TPA: PEGA domain-containing protein [Vicinamibacterales bacterium]|jgi:PEGA domain|nr:PEGA domain-containing protein [Vicinamibacterales bacterium]